MGMPSYPSAASLVEFTAALFSSGQVAVERDADLMMNEAEVRLGLQTAFEHMIEELPGTQNTGLAFSPVIGVAAARYVYRLCLALADRAMSEEQVLSVCAAMPEVPLTPDEVLSVDLTLRHLPEIYQMARTMSDTDPLLAGLQKVARRFPLSSVGIPLEDAPELSLLHRHEGLWRFYLDRVLERQDAARLSDPAVAAGVKDALGMHRQLAPKLSAQFALADT
jgi:hypothetical protein